MQTYRAAETPDLQVYAGFDHQRSLVWCGRGAHAGSARHLQRSELGAVRLTQRRVDSVNDC